MFDYVIVGAGTAGSIIASRLSENPNVSVAVFEAGGENTNDLSRIPGAFFLVWGTDYDWSYNTVEQPHLNGRKIYHPRGKVVGGSSAINFGLWARGTQKDYDSWESMGAKGWNFDKALEKFHILEDTDRGPNKYRGKGGMIRMEDAENTSTMSDKLLEAYLEAGFGAKGDPNGKNPVSINSMEKIYRNNVRQTPADVYLSPEIRKRDNLTVFTNALVTRILFEGTKVTGIEVEINGKPEKIQVHKEVILSAGTFNTPKLLKLSGVGPKEELKKHNIPVVADVPGVGENLRDHTAAFIKVISPAGTKDSVPSDISDKAIAQWRKDHSGPATHIAMNKIGFLSTTNEIAAPDFELLLGYIPVGGGQEDIPFKNIADIKSRIGYQINMVQLIPESYGSVKLASSNPHDAPIINPQYFSNPLDMERFIKAIRKIQQITQTQAMAPYTEVIHPPISASDKELEEFIRAEANTVYHPVGTAKMGDITKDPMAVVDSSLKVRGVEGLRVADASVMPQVTRGHTMAPTTYIGETAAELIKKEW